MASARLATVMPSGASAFGSAPWSSSASSSRPLNSATMSGVQPVSLRAYRPASIEQNVDGLVLPARDGKGQDFPLLRAIKLFDVLRIGPAIQLWVRRRATAERGRAR
jgi:hypothetical protein